jgi:hypothetical protein
MFQYWQEIAKKRHLKVVSLGEALRQLETAFSRFADTPRNRDKQAYLMNEFISYMRRYKAERFEIHELRHQFRWSLISQVRLTGLTPSVFRRDDSFYAYFCQEKQALWQDELKFPLLQRYMSDHVLHCRLSQLQIGVYFLEKGQFEFRRYTPFEVRTAVQETTQLFTNIYAEYSRLREKAGH